MAYEVYHTGKGYPSRTEIEQNAIKRGFTYSYWATDTNKYKGDYDGDTVVIYDTTKGMDINFKADAEMYGQPISSNLNIPFPDSSDEDIKVAISDIRRTHSKIVKFLKKHQSEFNTSIKTITRYLCDLDDLIRKYRYLATYAPDTEDGKRLKTRIELVSYDLEQIDKLLDKLYEASNIYDNLYL